MFEDDFADRVLPFDQEAAIAYGDLFAARSRVGRPPSTADLMIASIARAKGARARIAASLVGPVTTKLCKVAIRGDRCVGSASASRRLGYLSPEASLSAMLSVQTAGEGLVCLESAKVLDA
jgi:hypothetical protein